VVKLNQGNHEFRKTKPAPKIWSEVVYVFYCLLYWCVMQLLSICCSYIRTLEDVQTQHAKLFDGVLQPLTQVLSFAQRHEGQGKYRFLEIDTTLLNSLHKGQRYLICVKIMLTSQ